MESQVPARNMKEDADCASRTLDPALERLLNTFLHEVREYAKNQISHIKRLNQIGVALSSEKDLNRLLEIIIDEACRFTNADGGTIYLTDPDHVELRVEVLHNHSMNIRMGGTSGITVNLPPVKLEIDGSPNYSNVSSYSALTGKSVNIADVYESEFNFTGPRQFDKKTGYRTKSMLIVPLKNHENVIIGVLQLINSTAQSGAIVPFDSQAMDLTASLASQAAVAITKERLVSDLQNLLHSFIKSIAIAVDAMSPFTGGHISRVVDLVVMIVEQINSAEEGPFADIHFTEENLEEIKMATWMHDIGKITIPSYIVDKHTKLEFVSDGIDIIRLRFDFIGKTIENEYLKKKLELLENGSREPAVLEQLDGELKEKLHQLEEEFGYINACNMPVERMEKDRVERLRKIGEKSFTLNGSEHKYLTDEEMRFLLTRKGSLSEEERKRIEEHALMAFKMLNELPFPKRLANVPRFASLHHEKLDGTGYPFGLKGDEIPLEARIMAIADIFEALTAPDRPYRQPMKLSQAMGVLKSMAENSIDRQIYELIVSKGIDLEYAKKNLPAESQG